MRLPNYLAGAALLISASATMAQTSPPSAVPQVTVSADTKLLIFDWQPVPGATYYQLYVNADGHSGFSKTGGQIAAPGTRAAYSVPVHLQHWQDALFRLSACNAAGCRDSKSLYPRRHMLETIGYFKASNTNTRDGFGNVTVSGDGSTLVVGAVGEDSNATGINGNQLDNSLTQAGALYVYRKVGGHWRQEAYVKSDVAHDYRRFGAVALSNDGSLLAVGTSDEAYPTQSDVTVYVRASNGTWSLQSTLQAPEGQINDDFGTGVDLSSDGSTLLVNGFRVNGIGGAKTPSYIFVRSTSGSWEYVPSFNPTDFCRSSRLSGDGSTVVRLCTGQGAYSSQLHTYKRSGSTWTRVHTVEYSTSLNAASISNDAALLALSANSGTSSSSYYVLIKRWENGNWVDEGSLSAPFDTYGTGSAFGSALSLSGTGSLLAIGDGPANPPAPPGVTEEIAAGTPTRFGTVFIYQRHITGPSVSWDFRAQVMAPNPDVSDFFGSSVSMSASGATLAVGALGEDSKATGINGNQADNSQANPGAAYLY